MKPSTIITVKEWFFDKTNDAAHNYGISIHGEYTVENGITMLDHTKFRVDEVLGETEKAWHVIIDAENASGYKGWNCWIPKSVIVA